MELPSSTHPLLVTGDDDSATLRAALDLVDGCDCDDGGGVSNTSAIVNSVHAFLNDWEPRQDESQAARQSKDRESSRSATSLQASRRQTPAQKLQELRLEEYELSSKLETLLLQAGKLSLCSDEGSAAQVKAASLSFWGATAKRQRQYRLDSERENKRLRELVAVQTSQAKKLQQAWRRKLESFVPNALSTGCGNTGPQSNDDIPADTPTVFAELLKEVESVYTDLGQFLESRGHQGQQWHIKTFHEHSDSRSVPFERHLVDRAMWKAFAFSVDRQMVKFYCDLLDVTDDAIASAFHRVVDLPAVGVYLQIRLAGRKYHETDRTVFITRAVVEPLHLQTRKSLGRVFRETHVRVVTPIYAAEAKCRFGAASTIDSYISVTRENAKGSGMLQWSGWGDGHVAREMWNQATVLRTKILDDVLFEEARAHGQM